MRDCETGRVVARNPDLDERVTRWRTRRPDGTLEDAVRDLDLWHKPRDRDARRIIWGALKRGEDPTAMLGFQAMRSGGKL